MSKASLRRGMQRNADEVARTDRERRERWATERRRVAEFHRRYVPPTDEQLVNFIAAQAGGMHILEREMVRIALELNPLVRPLWLRKHKAFQLAIWKEADRRLEGQAEPREEGK